MSIIHIFFDMFLFALTKIVPSGSPEDTVVIVRDSHKEGYSFIKRLFPTGYSVKAYYIDRPYLFLNLWFAATDTSFPVYSEYACIRKLPLSILLEALNLNDFLKIPSYHENL